LCAVWCLNGKIAHPDMEAALKTDVQFDEMMDEKHDRDVCGSWEWD